MGEEELLESNVHEEPRDLVTLQIYKEKKNSY